MQHPVVFAIVTTTIALATPASAQDSAGPRFIPFSGISGIGSAPPTSDNVPLRPMCRDEFRQALDDALENRPDRRPLSEQEIEDLLTTIVGMAAGEAVGMLGGRAAAGPILRRMTASDFTKDVAGDPVSGMAEHYFRTWYQTRDGRDRLAKLMHYANVDPTMVDADPDSTYRGSIGYMEIWIDVLNVTSQQHQLQQVRNTGSSTPVLWLDQEIAAARSARRDMMEAAGLTEDRAADASQCE